MKLSKIKPFSLMAKEGYVYALVTGHAPMLFFIWDLTALAVAGIAAFLFVCWFFRDPERIPPSEEGALASPADGVVIVSQKVETDAFHGGPCFKISIFMNIFNVHVNRAVCSGTVRRIRYSKGKFLPANKERASWENEYNAFFIETDSGRDVCMVQVAGLVARRIVSYIKEGVRVDMGERVGIICFGSRVDVYLPADFSPAVKSGDRVRAGETTIGWLK